MRKSNICPQCGNQKDSRARLCANCSKRKLEGIDYSLLTPQWLAFFAGVFISEGSVGLYYDGRARGSYHLRISIKMREDEKIMLEDFVEKLGGGLYPDKARGTSNPGFQWASTNTLHNLEVCNLILENSFSPAKKLKEVQLAKEFCEWRLSQGYRVSDWTFAEDLSIQLSRCKVFSNIS